MLDEQTTQAGNNLNSGAGANVMPTQDRDTGPKEVSGKRFVFQTAVFILMIVFVVSLGLYVRNSFESLEEKLSYQPPTTNQAPASGAYGIEILEGQIVYVPVYSHIYADGGKPYMLETTLSIRNVDPKRAITVKSVKYIDTNGAVIKEYLDGEMALPALATAEFLVEKQDIEGGSGANFIVMWDAKKPVYEPLIEAVMVGFADAKSISFTSPGRALIQRLE
jgi:hypothetical protein